MNHPASAASDLADRLTALAGWIDARLNDEHYDRQAIAETAAAQVRELAGLAASSPPPAARAAAGGPGRAAAAAILRAVAGLIEMRTDIPQPHARIHFVLTRYDGPDIAAAVTAIAAAVPCQWRAQISRAAGHDWLDLVTSTGGASVGGTDVNVSAPAEAVCAGTGTAGVTASRAGPRALSPNPSEGTSIMSDYLEEAAKLLRQAAADNERSVVPQPRRIEIAREFAKLAAIERGIAPADLEERSDS